MTDTTIQAAKRALIRYPFLKDLDGKEVNGARAYFLIAQQDTRQLTESETVGQAITDTLHYMLVQHPGLIDMMFSPDGILRRLREAKEELDKHPEQVQPALS